MAGALRVGDEDAAALAAPPARTSAGRGIGCGEAEREGMEAMEVTEARDDVEGDTGRERSRRLADERRGVETKPLSKVPPLEAPAAPALPLLFFAFN